MRQIILAIAAIAAAAMAAQAKYSAAQVNQTTPIKSPTYLTCWLSLPILRLLIMLHLTADIDLASNLTWRAGFLLSHHRCECFFWYFNGARYKIKNLTINEKGFFSVFSRNINSYGEVKYLILEMPPLQLEIISYTWRTGGKNDGK